MSRKLTEEQVREIHASSLSCIELGEKYGVHKSTIYDIKRGKSFPYLKLGPTRKYSQLRTERELGLPPRRFKPEPITAHQIFVEEGWIIE